MFRNLKLLFAVALKIASAEETSNNDITAVTYREFEELIKPHGYTWDAHTTTTDDGYILTMFRITDKDGSENSKPRRPVLLAHGLYMDSTSWFKSAGQENEMRPLPLSLFDAGFDVWLSNARGTKYSQGHEVLRHMENSKDYWYWSFAEFGKFDAPSELQKIKEVTSQKVSYIGYHLSSTSMFIQLSM